ncbi:MAG TPA: DUF6531 domain-containing protein [Candidatus Tumulicola sp.]|nr:DUF6531 domain-containing protein [Candidatus Tumulicola sp.]
MTVNSGSADPDGTNRWWGFQSDSMGGIGRWMVNLASGTGIVQADDMAIPNKGIEFAFRRTYNTLSYHDYGNSDGSSPSLYGDKWTNTFDSHIAVNSMPTVNGQHGISVYNIDGARYDYAPVGDGVNFITPAGQFAGLYYNGSSAYLWVKKSGTAYTFWDVNQLPSQVALAGQIAAIYGRNYNTYLTFARSFTNGDASSLKNLQQTNVIAEDGRVAILTFGDVTGPGGPYRLLQSLVWPDGTTAVTYGYTIEAWGGPGGYSPRLTEVDEPGNGSTASGKLVQQYYYGNPYDLLLYMNSPRWVINPHLPGAGPAFGFSYGSYGNVLHVNYFGDVNPRIPDPTNSFVQPNFTPDYGINNVIRSVNFCYPAQSGCPSSYTAVTDTDGHSINYTIDTIGRVTQIQATTGDGGGGVAQLTGSGSWDASNDVTTSVDPRNLETDYVYDSNGNTVAVAAPAPSPGAFRPTSYYSYDTHNNLTAACDPAQVHEANKDWATPPPGTDSLCSSSNGILHSTQYVWTVPGAGYEPDGELAQVTTPLGYSTSFVYNVSRQGGSVDYGLPTQLQRATITQFDGSQLIPEQDFVYDAYGNLVCYSKGLVSGQPAWWILQYDAGHLGRVVKIGDPDDASLSNAACAKTPGLPSSTIVITRSYLANGQVATVQTPFQAAQALQSGSCWNGGGCPTPPPGGFLTSYTYDANGNEVAETHNFGNVLATTQAWYDGNDRLVEVRMPTDTGDLDAPHLTRYFYDLSQNGSLGTISVGGTNVVAHGNLFKSQEYINAAWTDVKGNAFDALDRAKIGYFYAPGNATLRSSSATFDGGGLVGLPSQTCDLACSTFSYDNLGRKTQISFNDGTPTKTFTYDANGRTLSVASSWFGTQSYTYDIEGKLLTSVEPNGNPSQPLTSHATISYDYYPNGSRRDLSVSSSGLTQTNMLQYSYRSDGARSSERFNYLTDPARSFAWNLTPAGRMVTTSDPYLNPSHTATYDAFGRLTVSTLVAGQYSNMAYDSEGELTSYSAGTGTISMTFNDRGQMTGQTDSQSYGFRAASLYGAMHLSNLVSGVWQDNIETVDSKNGVFTRIAMAGGDGPTDTFTFDAAGRQTSATEQKGGTHFAGAFVRQYDAENHLLTQNWAAWGLGCAQPGYNESLTVRYNWGPSGHPIQVGSSTPNFSQDRIGPASSSTLPFNFESLHWDGDTLLFTSSQSGVVDDVKIGTLADRTMQSGGMFIVWDRGPDGQVVSNHNAGSGAHDGWVSGNPFVSNCSDNGAAINATFAAASTGYSPPTNFAAGIGAQTSASGVNLVGWGGLIAEPRPDGFSDGFNRIQGVRSYDSMLQAWTTPDAYAGVLSDPMSQRPYAWNRNNPTTYADPSGFGTITLELRPVWDSTGNLVLHAFWHFELDDMGNGPMVFNLSGSFAGIYLNLNLTMDQGYVSTAIPIFTQQCTAMCAPAVQMIAAANAWPQNTVLYGGDTSNSNTIATYFGFAGFGTPFAVIWARSPWTVLAPGGGAEGAFIVPSPWGNIYIPVLFGLSWNGYGVTPNMSNIPGVEPFYPNHPPK